MGGILDLTPEDVTLATLIRDPGLIFSKVTQRFRLEPIVEEQVKENENESENGKDKSKQERKKLCYIDLNFHRGYTRENCIIRSRTSSTKISNSSIYFDSNGRQ